MTLLELAGMTTERLQMFLEVLKSCFWVQISLETWFSVDLEKSKFWPKIWLFVELQPGPSRLRVGYIAEGQIHGSNYFLQITHKNMFLG